jgi:DNA-binding SARP family transcriptional activator
VELGKTLAPRIYVTGHVTIEHAGRLIDEHRLAGRQGRRAFVYLTLHRATPVCRDDLVDVVWGNDVPAETDTALSAIVSKLRAALRSAGLEHSSIDGRMGTISLRLPADTHVDIEDAANAVDQAEGAWRRHHEREAWANANVAVTISRRSFLGRDEAPWIQTQREKQRTLLCRGLQVLSEVSAETGESELALQYANEIVRLEPFRETAYQHLMRLHAGLGNRGEALRVFAALRELLREELGSNPSPQTQAVFEQILTA